MFPWQFKEIKIYAFTADFVQLCKHAQKKMLVSLLAFSKHGETHVQIASCANLRLLWSSRQTKRTYLEGLAILQTDWKPFANYNCIGKPGILQLKSRCLPLLESCFCSTELCETTYAMQTALKTRKWMRSRTSARKPPRSAWVENGEMF